MILALMSLMQCNGVRINCKVKCKPNNQIFPHHILQLRSLAAYGLEIY